MIAPDIRTWQFLQDNDFKQQVKESLEKHTLPMISADTNSL